MHSSAPAILSFQSRQRSDYSRFVFFVSLQINSMHEKAALLIIANLKPSGGFGRAVKHLTVGGHAYAQRITDVDTGGLKAAHRMKVKGLRGAVFLAGGTGPSGSPREYGPYEHARGGSHAFYERTQDEAGESSGNEALRVLRRSFP